MPFGRQIENRQTTVPKADALRSIKPQSFVVGTSMYEGLAHGDKRLALDGTILLLVELTYDAAHGMSSSLHQGVPVLPIQDSLSVMTIL